MKNLLISLSILFTSTAMAQPVHWDAYVARYQEGIGSVLLNMDLHKSAPIKGLPYLVITGITYEECTGEGLPKEAAFNKLYKISENINDVVFKNSRAELVGTFSHQCQRLDYIYVADTTDLRNKLTSLYQKKYRKYPFHIRIIRDDLWDAYLNFLYPNNEVREFMANDKAMNQLRQQGDRLSKARFVEHLIYFEQKADQENFIQFIGRLKYDVVSTIFLPGGKRPYQLKIAKFEMMNLEAMTIETSFLRKKAKEFKGEYDGWVAGVKE